MMTPERKRNILRTPFILFVRVPILLPFYILRVIGEIADIIGQWLASKMIGYETEK